ncbi:MAG: DUF4434 domain-containing protein [Cyanobacteria bacterium QS_8_64_29]|nr:MAG: DUF4434 domain-containing protein [Cyanobacteria bacterium QS_8_64_29]
MAITGTFLDEITHDIPSQNWGPREWARDFDAMRAIGIDTVILIRVGYRQQATFDSRVLNDKIGMLPAYTDLVDLFLHEAERCGMQLFVGTYDSGTYWHQGQYQQEADLNKAVCEELVARYGDRAAFAGWYVSHEIDAYDDGMLGVYQDLAQHLRRLKDVPILISPYIRGCKQFGEAALSLAQHWQEWDAALARLAGHVDIVAFQDGNVALSELPHYLHTHQQLAARYGMQSWSNVESFDRDMPFKFPPIDFRKLRYKIERAREAGVSKLVTFEFSHFMSPHASYPAARHLYDRYREWLQL